MESIFLKEPFLNTAALVTTDNKVIELNNKVFKLENREIIAKLPSDAIKQLPNAIEHAERILVNELISDTSQLLHDKYLKLGEAAADSQISVTKKVLRKLFKLNFPTYVRDTDELGSFLVTRHPSIFTGERFCILPINLAHKIVDNPKFEPTAFESRTSPGGIYPIGTYAGLLEIYINTAIPYNSTKVINGFKTRPDRDGVYLIEGDHELLKTEAFAEVEGSLNLAIRSSHTIQTVGEKLTQYFLTHDILVKKKPFFRKLFNL